MSEIIDVVDSVKESVVSKNTLIGGFTKKELGVGAGLVAGGGLITEGVHQVIKHRPVTRFLRKVKRFMAFEKQSKPEKKESKQSENKTEKTE